MTALVARTGRHQQRYDQGFRMVAGLLNAKSLRTVHDSGKLCTSGTQERSRINAPRCIPYRVGSTGVADSSFEQNVEVLMITSQRGEGLLFPKGGWETDETMEEAALREALEEAGVRGVIKEKLGSWDFKSKRQQGEFCPDGLCRANMFALAVTEQLDSWPEQHARQRQWFPLSEAIEQCQVDWMREALEKCRMYLAITPTSVPPMATQHASHFLNPLPTQGKSLT